MGTSLPLPKYHQIYLILREQLQEGRFDQDG
ncbi:MAG: GntR family transcriptional regulator, partial [Castellaniella sp.]